MGRHGLKAFLIMLYPISEIAAFLKTTTQAADAMDHMDAHSTSQVKRELALALMAEGVDLGRVAADFYRIGKVFENLVESTWRQNADNIN